MYTNGTLPLGGPGSPPRSQVAHLPALAQRGSARPPGVVSPPGGSLRRTVVAPSGKPGGWGCFVPRKQPTMRPQWRLRGWELLPGPLVAQFRERMAGASMWGVSPHAKNTVFISWGSVATPPPRSSVRLAAALWAWGHREPLGARLPLALVVACSERRGPMGRPHSWISHRPVGWLRRTLWAQWLSGRTSCFAPFGRASGSLSSLWL